MPMKTRSEGERIRKKTGSTTVINLSKRKRKPSPYSSPGLLVEQRIFAGSVVNIASACNAMWLPEVKAAEIKEKKVSNSSNEVVGPPWKDSGDPRDQIAANDTKLPLCQDENEGLRLWLKAYCTIPNNVCSLDIDETTKIRLHQRTIQSQEHRAKLGRPVANSDDRHWKINRKGRIRYPVPGYPSARCPTVVDLLVQAYSKGYSFERAASKRFTIVRDTEPKAPEFSYEDHWNFEPSYSYEEQWQVMNSERYSLEQKRYYSFFFRKSFETYHPLDKFKHLGPMPESWDAQAYHKWLYEHDVLNPVVDAAASKEYFGVSHEVVPLSRYEGRKAAEYVPVDRYRETRSVHGDLQWWQYLCYYYRFRNGDIDEEMLRSAVNYIWEDGRSRPSDFIEKCKKDSVYPGCRSLPSPDNIEVILAEERDKEIKALVNFVLVGGVANRLARQRKESNQVAASKRLFDRVFNPNETHPSGHSQDEVYHLSVAKAWKRLPNSLLVPESYNLDRGFVEVSFDDIDKLSRLKTG